MRTGIIPSGLPSDVPLGRGCPFYTKEEFPTTNTAKVSDLRTIRRADIPEEYLDIYDALGADAFLKLVRLCGGQSLYLPKLDSLERQGRNRELRARFNGGNYRALAAQFRLSERQVRKILNERTA